MPTYTAQCPCGAVHDYICKIDDRNLPRQSPCCNLLMQRIITAVNFNTPFQSYECPVTGKEIKSVMEHKDNLERHGCHVMEKGEMADAERNRKAADAALEDAMANTAAELVSSLPEDKKQQLAIELATSTPTISRG